MTVPARPDAGPSPAARRVAALGALGLAALAVVVAMVTLPGDFGRVLLTPVLVLVAVAAGWTAATRTGRPRLLAGTVAVLALALVVVGALTAEGRGLGVAAVVALVVAATALARFALEQDVRALTSRPAAGEVVGPAQRGVLIMNLRSGGGKAERFGLVDTCRERGIEPIVLQPGDDLLELARGAIERGADVIGMAGGDGSQALVATVASAADVPLVCIPAGTRNHFALDIGLDRNDVLGALDAFGGAVERRIDLAEVNGRVFVNNVSLGVYAKIVQSPEYRDAKRQTTASMLPELLGPGAEAFDLSFTDADGRVREGVQIVQVSNNPYVLSSLAGFGSRPRLDTGELGIAAAAVRGAADVAAFVAAETTGNLHRFGGWAEWTAPTFTVGSSRPIEAGVDGEALLLDPPLEFRALPGALRIRIPPNAPGSSPAALRSAPLGATVRNLLHVAAGRRAA